MWIVLYAPIWTKGKSLAFIAMIVLPLKQEYVCSNQTIGSIGGRYMEISNSFNYKCFKKNIGQANHFLITVLVGLDGLEDHEEINIRSSFRTTWNPKNRIASIARSREFVKKSSLAWIIDCLDSYLIECNTKPKLIYDNELIKKLIVLDTALNENLNISLMLHRLILFCNLL